MNTFQTHKRLNMLFLALILAVLSTNALRGKKKKADFNPFSGLNVDSLKEKAKAQAGELVGKADLNNLAGNAKAAASSAASGVSDKVVNFGKKAFGGLFGFAQVSNSTNVTESHQGEEQVVNLADFFGDDQPSNHTEPHHQKPTAEEPTRHNNLKGPATA